MAWLTVPPAPSLGSSKSSTTVQGYEVSLGAYKFYERAKTNTRTVIRSLAYLLACSYPAVARHMLNAIHNIDILSVSVETQFDILFLKTLRKSVKDIPGSSVIILDSVDECGTGPERARLLRLMVKFTDLPKRFRFLIVSRREAGYKRLLHARTGIRCLEIDPNSKQTGEDIHNYLKKALSQDVTSPESSTLGNRGWGKTLGVIGTAANGSFIWAATVDKLVSKKAAGAIYLEKLDFDIHESEAALDALYKSVLEISLDKSEETKALFKKVFAVILASKEWLPDCAIDGILGLGPLGGCAVILSRLHAVVEFSHGKPIRLYHSSFFDFLTTSARSGDWFVDIEKAREMILLRCFAVMSKQLHFNIGGLRSSFIPNAAIAGLDRHVAKAIPDYVQYVSLSWPSHLREVPFSIIVLERLSSFVDNDLLFWFEVLSLTGNFYHKSVRALQDSVVWVPVSIGLFSLMA